MEDAAARHNLFRNHGDSSLYDGVVRPDPLARGQRLPYTPFNGTVAEVVQPPTQAPPTTTCAPAPHYHVTNASEALEAAGYAAYSTALGVTIAIGCSLLVLNVLIFAGVYYQRDRTRLEIKSLQRQHQGSIKVSISLNFSLTI